MYAVTMVSKQLHTVTAYADAVPSVATTPATLIADLSKITTAARLVHIELMAHDQVCLMFEDNEPAAGPARVLTAAE